MAENNIIAESPYNQPCSSSATKLGICEVCGREAAKYTCPRCEVKTCCLNCSKIHKKEVECSGIRDKTKFIPMNKYTNMDLSSDYRLLEEVSRVVEASKKGMTGLRYYGLTKRYLLLQQQALARKIPLKFLPKNFIKHKRNTSMYNTTKKIIEWHIDWVFVNSENFTISEEKVPENLRLSSIINKYLVVQDNVELQEKLQFYQAADLPGIKLLLKAEQRSGRRFYELDSSYSLKEILQNKVVIEYPTIHLVLRDQSSFYDIIDSDDDEEAGQKELLKQRNGKELINKMIKKSESNDSLLDSLQNLLFMSEYSDEEADGKCK